MKIDENKLLENFKNLKNIGNFNILKCLKVLFSKKGILNNVGFFIIIPIIIFHLITLFVFYLNQFEILKNKIKDIILIKLQNLKKVGKKEEEEEEKEEKNKKIMEKESKEKEEKEIEDHKKKLSIMNNIIIINENLNDNINSDIFEDDKKLYMNKKGKTIIKKKKIKLLKNQRGYINSNNNNDNIIDSGLNSDVIIIKRKKDGINTLSKKHIKTEELKKLVSIIEYTDDEINDLSYDLALINDKRSYCQYYFSLIKTKHEFLYAFFYNKDYNSKIIKIDLFLFGFALNYTVNGFFFTDETMHNVYENKGLFDLSYQLPIIAYSSFISMFFGD